MITASFSVPKIEIALLSIFPLKSQFLIFTVFGKLLLDKPISTPLYPFTVSSKFTPFNVTVLPPFILTIAFAVAFGKSPLNVTSSSSTSLVA